MALPTDNAVFSHNSCRTTVGKSGFTNCTKAPIEKLKKEGKQTGPVLNLKRTPGEVYHKAAMIT